jgi:chromosome segregation ATPase
LVARLVGNAELRVRVQAAREKEHRLGSEAAALDAEVRSRSTRAEQVAQEVSQELKRRLELDLAMSVVLARAKALQEQRDHFRGRREEVQAHLRKMDQYYSAGPPARHRAVNQLRCALCRREQTRCGERVRK